VTTLPEYKKAYNQAQSLIAHQEKEISLLREKIQLLQYRQFTKSAETLSSEVQELLFEVPEVNAPAMVGNESIEIAVKAHTKKKPGRKGLREDLPREEVIIDLPDHEKFCTTHQTALKKIGNERSESLKFTPATYTIIETVRPKYVCECCEEKKVVIAPVPERLIPRSIVTPSLLAHIAIAKFCDHLPLYRQEAIFLRDGIEISRTSMASWMIRLGDGLIPIMNLLQEKLIAGEYLSCDETPLRVLTDDGKPVKNLHYLWVRGRPPEWGKPIYLFEYANSRRAEVAKEILEDFRGYLQVDQYIAYDSAVKKHNLTKIGCLAHVRRKFHEAEKVMKGKASIPGRALALIAKIYKIDKEVKLLPSEKRTAERKTRTEPLLKELKFFIEDSQKRVPPQSAIGKAISYTLNAWEYLENIYLDHRIKLDNNLTENEIRPVAIGRKNYLFCHSTEGAEAAARIYSVIATAKANGLNIKTYFENLIENLPKAKTIEDYEALLPLA
jgi:transposase